MQEKTSELRRRSKKKPGGEQVQEVQEVQEKLMRKPVKNLKKGAKR